MPSKLMGVIVIIVIVAIAGSAVGYYAMNSNQQNDGGSTPANSDLLSEGVALYEDNCSRCHNPLESSNKKGHSASEIQEAINEVGAMSSFSSLTTEQIRAIAEALKR